MYIDKEMKFQLEVMHRKLVEMPKWIDIGYSIRLRRKSLSLTREEVGVAIGSYLGVINIIESTPSYEDNDPSKHMSYFYHFYKVINYLGLDLDNDDMLFVPPKTVPINIPKERLVYIILEKLPKLSLDELFQVLRLLGKFNEEDE